MKNYFQKHSAQISQRRIRRLFHDVAEKFNMVYFGSVSQTHDEHEMVRGFTLSPSHIDRNYCVGTVNGYDVIALERTDTISFPDRPSKAFSWIIVQVDLRRVNFAPHIILNSTPYDQVLYDKLVTIFFRLRQLDALVLQTTPQDFLNTFQTFGSLHQLDHVAKILTTDTTHILTQEFSKFDFECFDDRVIVYSAVTTTPTLNEIETMLRAGTWFADQIDNVLALR